MAKKFGIDWGSMTEKLNQEMNKGAKTEKTNNFDQGFYYPDFPKDGKFKGKIRFLPSNDLKSLPIVKKAKHSFEENGKWFNEECYVTYGRMWYECPICKAVN